jgi:transposase-like protein
MTWETEDAARIVGMYRAGVSIKDIARRFGTTTGAVTQLMRRKGAYRTLTRQPIPRVPTKTHILIIQEGLNAHFEQGTTSDND